jgi:hypothetical protein
MQKLMSQDSLPTLFAFAPLILFLGVLKSSQMLGISPGLMVRLQAQLFVGCITPDIGMKLSFRLSQVSSSSISATSGYENSASTKALFYYLPDDCSLYHQTQCLGLYVKFI